MKVHKKVFSMAAIFFLFSLSHNFSYSAVAAGDCKSIKKEVIRLENLVRSEQKSFLRFEGMRIQGTIGVQFERSVQNEYLRKLGKVSYNNQKCFTRSQYDQILRTRYWTSLSTISVSPRSFARDLECKNNPSSRRDVDLGIYEPKNSKPGVICDVPTYFIVNVKYKLYGDSIYKY